MTSFTLSSETVTEATLAHRRSEGSCLVVTVMVVTGGPILVRGPRSSQTLTLRVSTKRWHTFKCPLLTQV